MNTGFSMLSWAKWSLILIVLLEHGGSSGGTPDNYGQYYGSILFWHTVLVDRTVCSRKEQACWFQWLMGGASS